MYNPVAVEMYVKAKREYQWTERKWTSEVVSKGLDTRNNHPQSMVKRVARKIARYFPDTWMGKRINTEDYGALAEENC